MSTEKLAPRRPPHQPSRLHLLDRGAADNIPSAVDPALARAVRRWCRAKAELAVIELAERARLRRDGA